MKIEDLPGEEWRDIAGYEGYYQVSNLARIKSLERFIYKIKGRFYHVKEKILKPSKDTDGYYIIGLYKNRKLKHLKLHRIIALAFLKNPNNYPKVLHKYDIKLNNHPLKGKWSGYRSINISGDLRALYKEMGEDKVIFTNIGSHNQLYG